MITKQEGFYAINGIRTIVDKGLVVSFRDDAVVEEFDTLEELNEAYPEQNLDEGIDDGKF